MPLVVIAAAFVLSFSALGYLASRSDITAINTFFPAPSATVLFGGDMMFDRTIRTTAEEKGDDYLFSCITDTLRTADVVVANLEGPITSSSSKSVGAPPRTEHNTTFTFPTTTATLLARHNIRIVNLGNNHIYNFGREGVAETRDYLKAAGVAYFGDPDVIEPDRVLRTNIEGVPFSFVNWSDWTSDNTDITAAQVKTEAEAGRVVVVYTHWGEEYVPPTDMMRRLGRSLVDVGASIVMGTHPHIVQEHEEYKGKHIYYSLGNFVFDQYFSDAVSHGLLLEVVFDKKGVRTIKEIPVELTSDRRVCIQ